jgi:hypothetical protein
MEFIFTQPLSYKLNDQKRGEYPIDTYITCDKCNDNNIKKLNPRCINTKEGFWHCGSDKNFSGKLGNHCTYNVCVNCEPNETDGEFIKM